MKKILALLSVFLLSMSMFVGCGSSKATNDELVVYFVPSRNPEEIQSATAPLAEMLKNELSSLGFDFEKVRVEVGTSFEAVGEALASGTAQVGFIPGGTYVLYDDGVDVALTATRFGLSHDSEYAADWNTAPTENTDEKVTYYRSLVIAGPSKKGQELAAKVNNGEELTLEDIQSATWGVSSNTTSPAVYIYPSLLLQDNFGISITDLQSKVALDNYATALSQLASEQIDIMVTYADARLDYADQWTSEFGRTNSIWDETNVIGVTEGIYNDTVAITKAKPEIYNEKFIAAIQNALINVISSEEGKEIFSVYSHTGYAKATDSDYDGARAALELVK